MSIITLLTDFGLKDGNVGVMKGVIWKIAPEAQIADLSHLIPPQDVQEGALILSRSAPYFPPGTIHVAVVDPGVGTARRPIAARLGGQFFVLPDNGLITLLLEQAEAASEIVEFVHLDRPNTGCLQSAMSSTGATSLLPVPPTWPMAPCLQSWARLSMIPSVSSSLSPPVQITVCSAR